MFRESTGGSWSGDITPSIATLMGRLIFLTPVEGSHDPDAVFGRGTPEETSRPQIRANVLVLDGAHLGLVGGELTFGGKGSMSEPHTDRIGTPAFFQGVLVSNGSIVKDLVTADEERRSGKTGGWIMGIPVEGKGSKGNNPIHIGKIKTDQFGRERPNHAAIYAFLEQQFTAYLSGSLQLHSTSTLIPPTPQASPDVHKKYQERLQARASALQGSGEPATVATAAVVQPTQYAPGATTLPVMSTATGTPVIHQQAVPVNPDDEVPPNYDAAAWANLDAPIRTMIWGSIRGAAAVQPTH